MFQFFYFLFIGQFAVRALTDDRDYIAYAQFNRFLDGCSSTDFWMVASILSCRDRPCIRVMVKFDSFLVGALDTTLMVVFFGFVSSVLHE